MKKTMSIALLLLLPASANANDPALIQAAWKPAVIFAGNGDPKTALQQWQQVRDIQALMAEKAQTDLRSHQFANQLWGSLEDFNLKKFHTMLPNENGPWREFNMHGKREGEQYHYYDITPDKQPGDMLTLGETRLTLRSRQVETTHQSKSLLARGDHYLLSNEWAIGWGSYNWQSFRDAVNASTQLLYPAPVNDSDPQIQAARAQIAARNPLLDAQDVEILLPLQLGFPHLSNHFSSYGSIRDVVVSASPHTQTADITGLQPKRVSLTIAIDRQRLQNRYPAINDYLERVDNLATVTLDIANTDGKLLTVRLDSTDLSVHLDTLVLGDALIPEQNGVAQLEKPFRLGNSTHRLTAVANATVDVFGVTTEINGIQSEALYAPNDDQVQLSLRLNRIPTVDVHGAAFGFLSTKVIDAFLPTNLDEIILDFMEIATLGNDGHGIETDVHIKNTPSVGVTHVAVAGRVEALDSRLIRMGMSIINGRLMPDENQSQEFSALVQSGSRAFQQDLAQYEELSRRLIARND